MQLQAIAYSKIWQLVSNCLLNKALPINSISCQSNALGYIELGTKTIFLNASQIDEKLNFFLKEEVSSLALLLVSALEISYLLWELVFVAFQPPKISYKN